MTTNQDEPEEIVDDILRNIWIIEYEEESEGMWPEGDQ